MTKIIASCLITLSLAATPFLSAQTAGDDMRDAGRNVKKAGKATGNAAKDTGKATAKETKKATHATARGVKKGANKVEEKTRN